MDAIGGYFGLEERGEGEFPHQDGVLLNTGRNSLEYILRSIGKVNRIFLPYYTCDAVLEPIQKLGISRESYHIDENLEIKDAINPGDDDYIIVNNYFGIKDKYIQQLSEKYGKHLIADCAQALFYKSSAPIKSFYSPRKFVGVADGGIAYVGDSQGKCVEIARKEQSGTHDSHLYLRKERGAQAGFQDYQRNEQALRNQAIRFMSDSTKDILHHIDYEKLISKRRENYSFLDRHLKAYNKLSLPGVDSFACPMAYPFIPENGEGLRQKLIQNRVFVARYWPNVSSSTDFPLETSFSEQILPLPCDQRYTEADMNTVINLILKYV